MVSGTRNFVGPPEPDLEASKRQTKLIHNFQFEMQCIFSTFYCLPKAVEVWIKNKSSLCKQLCGFILFLVSQFEPGGNLSCEPFLLTISHSESRERWNVISRFVFHYLLLIYNSNYIHGRAMFNYIDTEFSASRDRLRSFTRKSYPGFRDGWYYKMKSKITGYYV